MRRMDPTLRPPLPDGFIWANSAHTDFPAAHIIVIADRTRWAAVAIPRKRAPGWEAWTGVYRNFLKRASLEVMLDEGEAVRWIATWVRLYADRIPRDAGGGERHPPVAPRQMLERLKFGR